MNPIIQAIVEKEDKRFLENVRKRILQFHFEAERMKRELTDELILHHFPHDTAREGQIECIRYICDQFLDGKQYCIIEAPTGAGKSAIALTVASIMGDTSYYLTIQKILQTQIINDYGDDNTIVDLKGRNAYPCTFYHDHGQSLVEKKALKQSDLEKQQGININCDEGYCRTKLGKFKCEPCIKAQSCPYYEQVEKAISSKMCVMNFNSFLYQTTLTKRFVEARDTVIIDECHNLEQQLLNFAEVRLSDRYLEPLGISIPQLNTPEEYWFFIVENEILEVLGALAKQAKADEEIKKMDEYNRIWWRINRFIRSIDEGREWVSIYSPGKHNAVTLKPIFAQNEAQKFVFSKARHVLLMSATVLDPNLLARSLGIPQKDLASYRMKNRFPVENRPIYFTNTGAFVYKDRAKWMPKLVEATDEIIERYPDERGIIHTHNFSIADTIIRRSKFKSRLFFQRDYHNKDEMLKEHAESGNGILVAPAMHEGLDLKHDLSRFQIICKVPWPNYVDDPQLARRMELDQRYYRWLTALKLVQSYGRSIRSEEDWADTYILDSTFTKFKNTNRKMLPGWFLEAIEDKVPASRRNNTAV